MVDYFEGGTGRQIHFDTRLGPQTVISPGLDFVFYPSSIRYPSGEQLTFVYQSYTANGNIHYRPASVQSSVGYTLALTYQSNAGGQAGWYILAQATIHQSGNPSVPLAQLSYSGNLVTDLGGRQWQCVDCRNALNEQSTVSATSLRLPGEAVNTMVAEAQSSTSRVGRVNRDGVDWNYAYVLGNPGPSPISKATVTGPLSFSQTINVYSPTLGRFLQTDPIGYEDQVNLYAYVGNDPVNLRDPSGMASCDSATQSRICAAQVAKEEKAQKEAAAERGKATASAVDKMADQLAERPGALTLAVAADLRHRDRGVVVKQRQRHPAEERAKKT